MIMTTHVLPADALEMVSTNARQAMGLAPTDDRGRGSGSHRA